MNFILTTERLHLQPCGADDLMRLHRLWTNQHIRYFLFDDRIISEDEARSFIQASLDSFNRYNYGLWLVYCQNQCIGFAGFLDAEEAPNLIYGIHPDCWGQGYATEAARAVLTYGLETLSLPRVNADVDEPNTASIRVLQKLGMKQVGHAIVNHHPLLYFTTYS
ncbi:GNAT family N-acetyltransferase [Leptolyngbya sp. NK1-12]|uniref:GNAT family N-acetyltransferase n=1 Tax=Leptolyngbya sp. NK1-12 TaxID=2547451 RepID=A0AA96WP46_9CYAN|nr:GNAT family N-acetyltransferase [Leptolyngbya sp. NK1-12]WNZ25721.1 GNAT family N-acetyltransferase [Leptolyngbya sp. NK1-12]